MITLPGVKDCFISAKKYKEKGRKHKGLLLVERDHEQALEYMNLCDDWYDFFCKDSY